MAARYKGKRWKQKREHILKRDDYQCQECRRYGKRVDANTVHHIYPVAEYPEYVYSNWNLISLCEDCHNGMHDRTTNALTAKGEALKRRISPPHPGC